MLVNHNHAPSNIQFKAKFLNSKSLQMLADYAVEHNKFDKLNEARKNISTNSLTTRLRFDMRLNERGETVLNFTKYEPKIGVIIPKTMEDYKIVKTTSFTKKTNNPLKFALEKFIKMGNCVPRNKIFRKVVWGNK